MLVLESEVRVYLQELKRINANSKDAIQLMLWRRKLDNLLERRQALKQVERLALSLVNRVDYSNIRPFLAFCAPKDKPIWTYLRNVMSSAPWQDRPGRAVYLFCMDAVSNGILGVIDLGSDLGTLGPRDKYIGWTLKRKMTEGALRYLINLGTCVPTQPFGWLTGGKFMSVSVTSQKIVEMYQKRYGDTLAAVTTTSLYGKSSQYERLKEYQYLGETNGTVGTGHISNEGRILLSTFLKKNRQKNNAGISNNRGGPGGVGTLNEFISVCKMLGENPEEYSAKQPRGVYFAELGDNVCPFLRGEISEFVSRLRPEEQITSWWLERWYSMRWAKKQDEICLFDFQQYRVDTQIVRIREAIKRADVGEMESRTDTIG